MTNETDHLKKLFIYGAQYTDIVKLIEAINRQQLTWELVGFFDDFSVKTTILGGQYQFLGGQLKIDNVLVDKNRYFVNNFGGHWKQCKAITQMLTKKGCEMTSLIHPMVDVNRTEIGLGCIIPEGCVIGGNSKLGNFVTVRLGGLISHDVTAEDYVFIGPGAVIGGHATLKRGCFVGIGAIVMGGVTIGEGSTVGAGAVVTKDVEPNIVVVGVPAKPLRKVKH